MSPSSFPRTLRAARPWLATAAAAATAAMMTLAVWLTPTTAHGTLGPGAAPPAVSVRANPAWPWLQLLWSTLPWGGGSSRQLHAARDSHPSASARHGLAGAGVSTSDTGGSSGDPISGTGCNIDPNGQCHPGP
jgi:hypothetical protein